ncbi:MAG: HAD family phosphatase [Erysipelotrichaceae bacterium]
MLKAIIFDMDGVIVDSEPYYMERLKEFIAYKGFEYIRDDFFGEMVGLSRQNSFKIIQTSIKDFYEDVDVFYDEYMAHAQRIKPDYMKLVNPHVKEILTYCQSLGLKIGLASSSPMEHIEEVLRELDIYAYFDSILSGHLFKESKPNPEIYLVSLENLGVKAEECIVIEDSYSGILAAKRAKIKVIGKRDLRYNQDQSLADEFVDDLIEIKKWISA